MQISKTLEECSASRRSDETKEKKEVSAFIGMLGSILVYVACVSSLFSFPCGLSEHSLLIDANVTKRLLHCLIADWV